MRMQTGPTSTTGSDVPWAEGTAALHALIQPSRVAVIGASPRPNHFANTPIANLRRYGFTGEIYPVNPLYQEVLGMPCYPSVADLPGIPDLALVVLRQALTVDIVKECAEAGVRAAIVVASGFAETGESDGIALQDALSRVAAEHGIRVCGPNTLGIANFNENVVPFVSGNLPESPPQRSRRHRVPERRLRVHHGEPGLESGRGHRSPGRSGQRGRRRPPRAAWPTTSREMTSARSSATWRRSGIPPVSATSGPCRSPPASRSSS